MRTGHPHTLPILAATLAGLGSAAALSACGSSAHGLTAAGATTATGDASPIALSRCMRAHGLPSFPDPTFTPRGGGPSFTVASPNAPAFQKAAAICLKGRGL